MGLSAFIRENIEAILNRHKIEGTPAPTRHVRYCGRVARAPAAANGTLDELTRFNEGIDQALTESVVRFNDQVDESRELYMGVLGHDLRTPLQVIVQSTAYP